MIFQLADDLATGGWGALDNITNSIGQEVSTQPSGFFPTPQRDKVVSEITAPAGGSGETYRETSSEMQSLLDVATPTEIDFYNKEKDQLLDLAAPSSLQNTIMGNEFAQPIDPKNPLADILAGIPVVTQVKTVVDEFMYDWGLKSRPTDYGKPTTGYPAGQNLQHQNTTQSKAADVVNQLKLAGQNIIDQVKGLFNLGYSGPDGTQPVFTIAHDIDPSTKMTAVSIGVILIIIVLLMRK